jgi:hypothetical protein
MLCDLLLLLISATLLARDDFFLAESSMSYLKEKRQ